MFKDGFIAPSTIPHLFAFRMPFSTKSVAMILKSSTETSLC